tara:strand:- start:48514 stop:48642 length:129 start_codon:yes stop_codon:yes gene_type:complete
MERLWMVVFRMFILGMCCKPLEFWAKVAISLSKFELHYTLKI